MQDKTLQADAFDSSSPEQYHLLVELGDNELLYILVHIPTNTCQFISSRFLFEKFEDLEQQIELDDLLRRNWKSVSVNVLSEKFLLVPSNIADNEEVVQNTFRLQFSVQPEQEVNTSLLTGSKSGVLYAISLSLKQIIDKYFSTASVKHHTEPFLNDVLRKIRENNGFKAFALFRNSALSFVVCKDTDIVFCNSFKYNASEDALYYILNVIQHFELKADELAIEISGRFEVDSELSRMISRFFPKLTFSKIKDRLISFSYEKSVEYEFVNLLNTYPCE